MPNHITNKITNEIADLLRNSDGQIDFNTILPMPKSLIEPDPQQMEGRAKSALGLHKKPVNDSSINSLTNSLSVEHSIKEFFEPLEQDKIGLLIQAIENIRDYGFAYWYPWAINNWGTKWNAYSQDSENGFSSFQTAWNHPEKVFIALSKKHSDIEIKVEYADEDTGANCGTLVYKNGEIISKDVAGRWDLQTMEEKNKWVRFALSLTDPDHVDERIAEYFDDGILV